jgi:hypothetical protein
MFEPWDNEYEVVKNIKNIKHLYQMRHACNLVGDEYLATQLNVTPERISRLYDSKVHGSADLIQFLAADEEKFKELLKQHEHEETERQQRIHDAHRKNERLIAELKKKREEFAGIGTNKAKRRLNKLAITDPLAKAVRLALEIEDKSISAKNSYGTYQEKIYKQKTKLILDLCQLFKEHNWTYGVQKSDVPPTTHVIYFDIPYCEQISWHFTPNKDEDFPAYVGEWDKKRNSTIKKLEVVAARLLQGQLGRECCELFCR